MTSVDAHRGRYVYGTGYINEGKAGRDETYTDARNPSYDVIDAQTGEAKNSPEVQELVDNGFTKQEAVDWINSGGANSKPVVGTAPLPEDVTTSTETTPSTKETPATKNQDKSEKKGVVDTLKDAAQDLFDTILPGATATENKNEPKNEPKNENKNETKPKTKQEPKPTPLGVMLGLDQPWVLPESDDKKSKPKAENNIVVNSNFGPVWAEKTGAAAAFLGLPDPYKPNTKTGRPAAQAPDAFKKLFGDQFGQPQDQALELLSVGITTLSDMKYEANRFYMQQYQRAAYGQDLTKAETFAALIGASLVNNHKWRTEYEDGAIDIDGVLFTPKEVLAADDFLYGKNKQHMETKSLGEDMRELLAPLRARQEAYAEKSTKMGDRVVPVVEKYLPSAAPAVRWTYDLPQKQLDTSVADITQYIAGKGEEWAAKAGDYIPNKSAHMNFLEAGVQAGIKDVAEAPEMLRQLTGTGYKYLTTELGGRTTKERLGEGVRQLGVVYADAYADLYTPGVDWIQEQTLDERAVGAVAGTIVAGAAADKLLDAGKAGAKVAKLKTEGAIRNAEIDFRNKHMPLRTDADLLKDAQRRFGADLDLDTAKLIYPEVRRDLIPNNARNVNDPSPPRSKHVHPDAKYEIPRVDTSYIDQKTFLQGSTVKTVTDTIKSLFDVEPPGKTPSGGVDDFGVTRKGGEFVERMWDHPERFIEENTTPGRPRRTGIENLRRKFEDFDKRNPGGWSQLLRKDRVHGWEPDTRTPIWHERARDLRYQGIDLYTYGSHSSPDILRGTSKKSKIIEVADSDSELKGLYEGLNRMASPSFMGTETDWSISLTRGKSAPNPTHTSIKAPKEAVVKLSDLINVGDDLNPKYMTFKKVLQTYNKQTDGRFVEFDEIMKRHVESGGGYIYADPKYFDAGAGVLIEHERILAPGTKLADNPFVRRWSYRNGKVIYDREVHVLGNTRRGIKPKAERKGGLVKTETALDRMSTALVPDKPKKGGKTSKLANKRDDYLQYRGPPIVAGTSVARTAAPALLKAVNSQISTPKLSATTTQLATVSAGDLVKLDTDLSRILGDDLSTGRTKGSRSRTSSSKSSSPRSSGGSSSGGSSSGGSSSGGNSSGGSSSGGSSGGSSSRSSSSRSSFLSSALISSTRPLRPLPLPDLTGPAKRKKPKKSKSKKTKRAKRQNTIITPEQFLGFHSKKGGLI